MLHVVYKLVFTGLCTCGYSQRRDYKLWRFVLATEVDERSCQTGGDAIQGHVTHRLDDMAKCVCCPMPRRSVVVDERDSNVAEKYIRPGARPNVPLPPHDLHIARCIYCFVDVAVTSPTALSIPLALTRLAYSLEGAKPWCCYCTL